MTSRRLSISVETITIAAILGVGFLVRFWRLGSLPAGIHPDEMAGLVGVLDELQHRMPIRPFFDYRIFYLPLYGVSEFVSSRFFGYDATAYRFPAVLYGLVTIVCTIGLTWRITKDRLTALVAGAVAAILPWEITVSRIAWENAAMLPFLMGGLWALRAGLEDERPTLLILAAVLFGVDAYSYRAALPDAVALAAMTLVLAPRAVCRRWRTLVIAVILFALILAPLVVSVTLDPSFFWRDRHIATTSLSIFFGNYLAHFAILPLFFRGDGNAQHGPVFGVLYLWMLPLMLAGIVEAFRKYGVLTGVFLLFWLAIYPLGGALTNDGVPHFLRTLIGAPLATILCAIGLRTAWDLIRGEWWGKAAAVLFCALVFAAFSEFAQAYFIVYPPSAADAFQFADRDLFVTIRANLEHARRICFEGLNDMNSLTLVSYYLRDVRLPVHEHLGVACARPGTLIGAVHRWAVPPNARLIATVQTYAGRPAYGIFLTK